MFFIFCANLKAGDGFCFVEEWFDLSRSWIHFPSLRKASISPRGQDVSAGALNDSLLLTISIVSEVVVVVKWLFLSLQYSLGLTCQHMLVGDGPIPARIFSQRPRTGVRTGWVSSV